MSERDYPLRHDCLLFVLFLFENYELTEIIICDYLDYRVNNKRDCRADYLGGKDEPEYRHILCDYHRKQKLQQVLKYQRHNEREHSALRKHKQLLWCGNTIVRIGEYPLFVRKERRQHQDQTLSGREGQPFSPEAVRGFYLDLKSDSRFQVPDISS